jgi:hypothetical protein
MKVQTITQHQFTYFGTQRSWIGSNVHIVREHTCPTSSPRTADRNEWYLRSISYPTTEASRMPQAEHEQPKPKPAPGPKPGPEAGPEPVPQPEPESESCP